MGLGLICFSLFQNESSADGQIVIPDHCSAFPGERGELLIKCPFEDVINGEDQYVMISFGVSLGLFIRGREVPPINLGINPTLKLDQINLDGLVYLFQRIRLCKGLPKTTVNDKNCRGQVVRWGKMLDMNTPEERYIPSGCKLVVSLTGETSQCQNCGKYASSSKSRKRKADLPLPLNDVTNVPPVPLPLPPPLPPQVDEPAAMNVTCEFQPNLDIIEDDSNDLFTMLEKVLPDAPDSAKKLLMGQMENYRKNEPRQRRWDSKAISVCLTLYQRSNMGYREWKEKGMLCGPSERLLR